MKIAICVPHMRQVEAGFARSLAELAWTTAKARPDIELTFVMGSSSNLPWSRTRLAREALQRNANWLFWLDSDMVFPAPALLRLLSLQKDVVGANCPRRSSPVTPTAVVGDRYVYTTREKAEAGEVERVDRFGLAVCLIAADVMRSIPEPWFQMGVTDDGQDSLGEDTFFFRKLQDAGHEAYVDHRVSGSVGHIHERTLTHADAVEDAARAAILGIRSQAQSEEEKHGADPSDAASGTQ